MGSSVSYPARSEGGDAKHGPEPRPDPLTTIGQTENHVTIRHPSQAARGVHPDWEAGRRDPERMAQMALMAVEGGIGGAPTA